jgi:hypothetical protein
MYQYFDTTVFNSSEVIEELLDPNGGLVAIKNFLNPKVRQQIAEYAKTRYEKVPPAPVEIIGINKVHQQVKSITQFEHDDIITKMRNDLNDFLKKELQKDGNDLFQTPLNLNVQELARYNQGSVGITPHLDPIKSINLVVIIVLEGHGSLYRCRDREGTDPRLIDTSEGNLILMRADGFKPNSDRPFHYITDIVQTRYIIVYRQYPENERPVWHVHETY